MTGFVAAAGRDEPVFTCDVRTFLERRSGTGHLVCDLELATGEVRRFQIPTPRDDEILGRPGELARRYILAEIYNHLTTLGGFSLSVYVDRSRSALQHLVSQVLESLQLEVEPPYRSGVGRVLNVLDRMCVALKPDGPRRFVVCVLDIGELPGVSPPARPVSRGPERLVAAGRELSRKALLGIDVGGTSIKAALGVNGHLVDVISYDWNPASCADVEEIVGPIVGIARSMRSILGRRSFDAVGLSFPDVVVQNRIVGGEVPKLAAMRANPRREFDDQFQKLTALNDRLAEFAGRSGVVVCVNDGPMAAFAAAVEIAAANSARLERGVFAHTLGTDLGTGLVQSDGSVPEMPLEVYNLILDIGSDVARCRPAHDVRSSSNRNTGVPGTPQKLTSQAGMFRIAEEVLSQERPELVEEIRRAGFVTTGEDGSLIVPEKPVDMRKEYQTYLGRMAERDEAVAEVFRRFGEYLAVVYRESERLLQTGLEERVVLGGVIRVTRCFELISEGARRREPELRLIAADSGLAATPLMRELADREPGAVAQFGLAIGAIYLANATLLDGG